MHNKICIENADLGNNVKYASSDFGTNTYDCDRVEKIAYMVEDDL